MEKDHASFRATRVAVDASIPVVKAHAVSSDFVTTQTEDNSDVFDNHGTPELTPPKPTLEIEGTPSKSQESCSCCHVVCGSVAATALFLCFFCCILPLTILIALIRSIDPAGIEADWVN